MTTMEEDDLDSLLPPNCPNPYYDTWDRHNSIAFSTATKGLRNAPGENNCFVNSAVQVFWHLDVFRRSYRRLSGHTCMGNSCIFCALKVIFTQFQFSDQSSLHPDALRKALAETFANQHRFQLGHMDDAAECFENILRRIHYHIASSCNEDTCTAPHCLPHRKFSLNIVEKVVCPCGASSSPLKFNEMVHYISATALVSQARVMQENGDILHPDRFGLLLRNANAMGDIRDCPGACGKKVQIRRTLLNYPDVVSIGLVWDSDHPSVETTTEVARNIGTNILMQDVFHSVMQDLRRMPKLQLVGLVCYYGKHYSTFVFHSKLQVWIYFDDATVREIGPRWEHVVDKCSKGRYQPLLLLYANPKADPVSVETAPKKRVMAPGYGIPGGPEEESSLDRTHESISSQQSQHRSRTPNPEPSPPALDQGYPRARSVTPSTAEWRDDSSTSSTSGEHSRQPSFLIAMSGKPDNKGKHQPRLGGQAGGGAGVPGPMMPVSQQQPLSAKPQHAQPDGHGDNYSDYTLSTSDQYRRPSLNGFEPSQLPLTPNMRGYPDAQRKESFSRSRKDPVRADVVRYQMDPSHPQGVAPPDYRSQGYAPQDLNPPPPALPPKAGVTPAFYQHGLNAGHPLHIRQRALSQGGDEAYGSDTGQDIQPQKQHTIVKPAAGSNYDHPDGLSHSHTPVQSGLATLPRRKKEMSVDSTSGHMKQGSLHDGADINRSGSLSSSHSFPDQRPGSNPKFYGTDESRTPVSSSEPRGLPPPAPVKQAVLSSSKDAASKKSTDADKKSKKLKKEMKKAEKKKSKSGETLKSPSEQPDSATSGGPVAGSEAIPRRAEEFRDDKVMYIDRRMVESILKHQGLQRQPSTHSTASHTSGSSIESDSLMGRLLASKHSEGGVPTDVSFDNVSIGSHKDSGYGSSDRNSSSSTGSGTVDPYTQYFISKSMVVPRNLNPQFLERPPHQLVSDFTAPNPQVYSAAVASQESSGKDLSGLSKEEMSRHLYETLMKRKVMHPIKESSQEDILKILPQDLTPTSSPARVSSPLPSADPATREGRPPPIPPKNFAAFQVSKSSHHKEPSIDSLDKDEVENDYFVSMCEKADELMDNCILAETQEDLHAALCYCDSALGCLKEAMNQTEISNKAQVYAQKKHNSCLLKSRSLFKRTSGHGSSDGSIHSGKRSSITSTDSDNSDKPVRRVTSKDRLLAAGRTLTRPGPQQQQASLTSQQMPASSGQVSTGRHQQQESMSGHKKSPLAQPLAMSAQQKTGQCGPQRYPSPSPAVSTQPMSGVPQRPGEAQPASSHMSRSASAEGEVVHARSSSNSSMRSSASTPCSLSQPQSTTRPVASSVSSQPHHVHMPLDAYGTLPRNRKPRRTSDPTGNSEVYQMYLNRQKNLQLTGSSSDSRESDSSSCDGNGQKKTNNTEIREMLESGVVQRQKQQFVGGQTLRQDGGERGPNGQRNSLDGPGSTPMHRFDVHTGQSQQPSDQMSQPGLDQRSSAGPMGQSQPVHRGPVYNKGQLVPGSGSNTPEKSNPPRMAGGHHTQMTPSNRPLSAHLTNSPAVKPSNLSQQNKQHPSPSGPVYPQQHPSKSAYPPTYPSKPAPNPMSVSGYSQPLPGHRGVAASHASTGSNSNHQGPQAGALPVGPRGGPHTASPPSYQPANQVPGPPGGGYGGPPSGVQQVDNGVQNLNLGASSPQKKTNLGRTPPPPPPVRTTSNPDFRQQLPPPHMPQPQQGHSAMQQGHSAGQSYQRNLSHGPGPELGPRGQMKGPTVARVEPNSHLDRSASHSHSVPSRPASCFESPAQPASHYAYQQRPPTFASDAVPGSQLKHASSSTGLNQLSLTPRPLERYSSQPDCQNLVDANSYTTQTDVGLSSPSYATSIHSSSNNNCPQDKNPASGTNGRSLLTSSVAHTQGQSLAATSNPATGGTEAETFKPNVRALASRFDRSVEKPQVKPKPGSGVTRTRSKSESGSKKPKSVLKNKKAKSGSSRPRKSVTFAEDISSLAAGYESAAELTSFKGGNSSSERAYYSDDEDQLSHKPVSFSDNDLDDVEDSSNSDEAPLSREELACQLCRKREMEPGKAYCSKCSFYMGRLVSS